MSEQERQQLEAEVARVDRRRAELEIVINTLAPDYRNLRTSSSDCGIYAARSLSSFGLDGLLCPELKRRICS